MAVSTLDPREIDRQIRNAFGKTAKKLQDVGLTAIHRYDKDGHYLIISLKSVIDAIRSKAPPQAWDYMTVDIVENELIVYCPRGWFIIERAGEGEEGRNET